MNKITVIQLLNKIANGEEVPKEIIYNNERLIFDNKTKNYIYESGYDEYWTDHFIINFDLNEEIEIIEITEEDKEIEPLNKDKFYGNRFPDKWEEELINKIDELVRKVNELKKGE